ncbi:hypothetical protein HOU26_gp59 [Escherichia phage IMM-002]|uniref:Uncharacterized protein n=1 Tax=Escherichia phage IMM-002 TaxID=2041760 RepID=A0A384WIN3_9CAUD|nr:hypothetical protein HOU26_gp59 [Escherichia phage IMM-002]ATI17018.1 hypothetical protein [Escherichia phage IMM-002]
MLVSSNGTTSESGQDFTSEDLQEQCELVGIGIAFTLVLTNFLTRYVCHMIILLFE